MPRILHIHASPRPDSFSWRLARAFLDAYQQAHPGTGCELLDLWEADLPAFDAPAAGAKYSVMHGLEPRDEQARVWRRVGEIIEHFKSAEMYVFSSPMWNFSIPYRLKQYIDILVQPGLTFTQSMTKGYQGLVTGRPAVLLLARGGAYPSGTDSAQYDMQRPYLETILRFIGLTDIRTVAVEQTLAGPDVSERNLKAAIEQARKLAAEM